MLYHKKVIEELEVKFVEISIPVWRDEDFELDSGEQAPFSNDGVFCIKVDVHTGEVIDWPKNVHFESFLKVIDSGTYRLLSSDMGLIDTLKEWYAPNELIVGEHGDYIDLKIKDGFWINWLKKPTLKDFERARELELNTVDYTID